MGPNNVVDQGEPATAGNGLDFVGDVAVPSESVEVEHAATLDTVLAGVNDLAISAVRKMHLAALVTRWEADAQSGNHASPLLRVFVRVEEGAFFVQQQLVRQGDDVGHAEPELRRRVMEDFVQKGIPGRVGDAIEARVQLPRVAH